MCITMTGCVLRTNYHPYCHISEKSEWNHYVITIKPADWSLRVDHNTWTTLDTSWLVNISISICFFNCLNILVAWINIVMILFDNFLVMFNSTSFNSISQYYFNQINKSISKEIVMTLDIMVLLQTTFVRSSKYAWLTSTDKSSLGYHAGV